MALKTLSCTILLDLAQLVHDEKPGELHAAVRQMLKLVQETALDAVMVLVPCHKC